MAGEDMDDGEAAQDGEEEEVCTGSLNVQRTDRSPTQVSKGSIDEQVQTPELFPVGGLGGQGRLEVTALL